MQVTIKYIDSTSIAPEEVVKQTKEIYGDSARVEITPDATDSFNLLYFAIQQHITMRQVHSFYDDGILYEERIKQLRKEVADLVEEAYTQVISDNEDKLS